MPDFLDSLASIFTAPGSGETGLGQLLPVLAASGLSFLSQRGLGQQDEEKNRLYLDAVDLQNKGAMARLLEQLKAEQAMKASELASQQAIAKQQLLGKAYGDTAANMLSAGKAKGDSLDYIAQLLAGILTKGQQAPRVG